MAVTLQPGEGRIFVCVCVCVRFFCVWIRLELEQGPCQLYLSVSVNPAGLRDLKRRASEERDVFSSSVLSASCALPESTCAPQVTRRRKCVRTEQRAGKASFRSPSPAGSRPTQMIGLTPSSSSSLIRQV